MIYHNNYLVVMKRFTMINKEFFKQIRVGRNNVTKQAVKLGEPIPLTNTFELGKELTISEDGNYIVIGNGIECIRVTAQLHFAVSNEQVALLVKVIRSGTVGTDGTIGVTMNDGTNQCANITIVNKVSKGDKFYITTNKDTTINPATGGGFRSYLMIEKIT